MKDIHKQICEVRGGDLVKSCQNCDFEYYCDHHVQESCTEWRPDLDYKQMLETGKAEGLGICMDMESILAGWCGGYEADDEERRYGKQRDDHGGVEGGKTKEEIPDDSHAGAAV